MRIGELASKAGVTRKAVRHYEMRGLLHPGRNAAGYRDYDERALEIVRAIRTAQRMGLRLDDLRGVLEHLASGSKPCIDLRRLIAKQRSEVAEKIAELRAFDAYLKRIETDADDDAESPCPVLACAESIDNECAVAERR